MAPCLFAAGTLNWLSAYRTERTLNFISLLQYTYLHLKVINLIEILIVKLEQISITILEQVKNKSYWILYCKTGNFFSIWQLLNLLKIRIRRLCPRKLVNFFLMWINVFLLENFLLYKLSTYRSRPTGGGARLYQGGRAPWSHAGYGPVVQYTCRYCFCFIIFSRKYIKRNNH